MNIRKKISSRPYTNVKERPLRKSCHRPQLTRIVVWYIVCSFKQGNEIYKYRVEKGDHNEQIVSINKNQKKVTVKFSVDKRLNFLCERTIINFKQ